MKILILVLCIFIGGCSTVAKFSYDDKGRITQISLNKAAEVEVVGVAKMNSKMESPLKNLINISALKK